MNMMIRSVAVLLLVNLHTIVSANEKPNDLVQMGAYIASDDMRKSEIFYKALFDQEPIIKLENFIAFDVSGGIFAIAKRDVYAPSAVAGTGAVPYIHSTDLAAVQARIANATGQNAPDIIQEPGIHLLKVVDPNGQLVEFFTLLQQ